MSVARTGAPRAVTSGRSAGEAPWGKLTHDADGCVVRSQTLAAHCRDVSAVFLALTALPGIARRLARLAGRSELDPVTFARIAYLVHLHDCGKVNVGFQARRDPRAVPVGHIAPLAALFGSSVERILANRAYDALAGARLGAWGPAAAALLDAIFSHHGRPWPRDDDGDRHAKHWLPRDGYDPILALAALRDDADGFLPLAISAMGEALPDAPAFVHAVAGLTQLADWVASSGWESAPSDGTRATWAAERVREIGFDPEPWRLPLRSGALPSFDALFGREPYPHQQLTAVADGQLVVLESETGSGKTEAALWRFATLFAAGAVDGLYFALPTRTAAVQLHARVEQFAQRLWPADPPPIILAVPGYLDRGDRGSLPPAPEPLDGVEGDTRGPPVWASEHPKRFFAALAAVGTVDQALLAALRVKHAHMRGAALMRHLLVVDEVHASDAYMRRLLMQLLRDHITAGGHALLLSATLGAEARHTLLVEAGGGRARDVPAPSWKDATSTPYPLLSATAPPAAPEAIRARAAAKSVAMELRPWLDQPSAVAEAALAAARNGAKVLVVRNTVDGAVEVQRALELLAGPDDPVLFRVNGVATLHHGRFAREDRRLLDSDVERAFGRTRPVGGLVLVGTQTLEQSLDLDADLLITDLCPADVLLQRLGRLHRHATDTAGEPRTRSRAHRRARAIVVAPDGGLAPFLRRARPGGLKRHGLGHRIVDGVPQGVYRDLTVLEATRRLIETRPCWKIPAMNRELVEGALHSEAIEALLTSIPAEEREAWEAHWRVVVGDDLSQGLVARDGALVRDRDFMDPVNARFDQRLVTRLGADDRLVDLPPGTVGPFGEIVGHLAIPAWLVPGVEAEAVARVVPDAGASVLRIEFGEVLLIYDRRGLRRAEEA